MFDPSQPAGSKQDQRNAVRKRVALISGQLALVLGLLLVWILSVEVRNSTSLVVLFFYSFPSEFLVGLVPHEPILVYYGQYHPAWIVALVAVVSTVMAEGLNYSFFSLFYGVPALRVALDGKAVRKLAELFSRMPFIAILVAGATPVPFFPVRFLVVMTGYSVWKYLLGVLLSRGPRFYLLALLGEWFDIPTTLILGIFLVMLLAVNVPALRKVLADSRKEAVKEEAEEERETVGEGAPD
jgi:membrane protein YqaA with SNARE-associated domain